MIYAKLFTDFSHSDVCRFDMQKRGDKAPDCLRVSVHHGCRTVTFSGALRELAPAVAAGRPGSGGTVRFIRMAIVLTGSRETRQGGIAGCSHRLPGRAHNRETIL